jgi:hypothetical protein
MGSSNLQLLVTRPPRTTEQPAPRRAGNPATVDLKHSPVAGAIKDGRLWVPLNRAARVRAIDRQYQEFFRPIFAGRVAPHPDARLGRDAVGPQPQRVVERHQSRFIDGKMIDRTKCHPPDLLLPRAEKESRERPSGQKAGHSSDQRDEPKQERSARSIAPGLASRAGCRWMASVAHVPARRFRGQAGAFTPARPTCRSWRFPESHRKLFGSASRSGSRVAPAAWSPANAESRPGR